MTKRKMIRTQICLTKKEKLELQKISSNEGFSVAELIRRIIDEYIKKEKRK